VSGILSSNVGYTQLLISDRNRSFEPLYFIFRCIPLYPHDITIIVWFDFPCYAPGLVTDQIIPGRAWYLTMAASSYWLLRIFKALVPVTLRVLHPTQDTKVKQVQFSGCRMTQVHAAAVASDAYTPAGRVSDLKWFPTSGTWHFECQVDLKPLEHQWLQEGDLAVLPLEHDGKFASLQGILQNIRGKRPAPPAEEGKSFIVEVELSKISELAWNAQEEFFHGASNWRLHFILIPPNEKKSIQLLRDMQRSSPLRGMRLNIPRSAREMKREMEMRPLVSIEEARMHREAARHH
jgi:hypothetical protein